MERRSISIWLVAIVFLGILVGVVGGGLMGGVAGYYVVVNRAPVVVPPAPAQLVAAKSTDQPQVTTNQTVTEDSAVIDVAKKGEPAVVTIVSTVQTRSRRFGGGTSVAEGSGVIVDQQGHIVTNAHVVDGAQQIQIVFADGTQATAQVVGADSNNDIAVLQVSGNVPAFVPFGDSNAIQLGERVVAIGSPLGSYRGSVTTGVVSGLDRSVQGSGMSGLIQTDAAINHGNSGGPLLNLSGQIVGINTLVVQSTDSGDIAEGLGFAIPSNTVSSIVQQIISRGGTP